jgi:hypothetical protein
MDETVQKIFNREFIVNFLAQFAFSFVSFILIPTIPIYLYDSILAMIRVPAKVTVLRR